MTAHLPTSRGRRSVTAPRVGFFGLLGAGNIGNDGSFEAVLAFVRTRYPDAALHCLCPSPEQVRARYGISASSMFWYHSRQRPLSGLAAIPLKLCGKILDAIRTAMWVRRHDVVIIPGAGVLEMSLGLGPWGLPYALFVLCASGRVCGTRVAFVSVGADVIQERSTRRLVTWSARLAHYRSYRDAYSRDAMGKMGIDTADDEVYADLAFTLPAPPEVPVVSGSVGVGVIAYHGKYEDRRQADDLYSAYIEQMKRFVRWLVDDGRQVRLFTGDRCDETAVAEILVDLRAHRRDIESTRVVAEPISSLTELMEKMQAVEFVVASRYHNVVAALKLSKPTLAIGYATKNDKLMAEVGMADFCQSIRSLDVNRLIEQFRVLESRREQLVDTMVERNRAKGRHVEQQFAALSGAVLDTAEPVAVPVASDVPSKEEVS